MVQGQELLLAGSDPLKPGPSLLPPANCDELLKPPIGGGRLRGGSPCPGGRVVAGGCVMEPDEFGSIEDDIDEFPSSGRCTIGERVEFRAEPEKVRHV